MQLRQAADRWTRPELVQRLSRRLGVHRGGPGTAAVAQLDSVGAARCSERAESGHSWDRWLQPPEPRAVRRQQCQRAAGVRCAAALTLQGGPSRQWRAVGRNRRPCPKPGVSRDNVGGTQQRLGPDLCSRGAVRSLPRCGNAFVFAHFCAKN